MPEGDTVWRQARDLQAVLEGQFLTSSDFRIPAHATLDLSGSAVSRVESRGKHLLMFVGGQVIHSHLSMDGHWDIYPAAPGKAAKWRRPAYTARVVLQTRLATAVGFSLGTMEVLPEALVADAVGHLGPDLLGPGWDAEEALRRLLAEPDRAIGLALLDQRDLAGIGNIYRNELCFLSRVHPAAAVAQVPDLPRMVGMAKRLLEVNKDRPQRSTTGGPARGEAASWVYGLAGKPCKRCGVLIRHAKLADPAFPARAARDIYWCPRCQVGP
ncbi:putative endonuclease VIII/DNA glycosylase [Arthrobacter sp. PAMC 25486]|uniref:DNA-formamidopyrimidine glycosylase family protein n=1 Tax=Arthrobacter sp. PAMC 25486 TaxID=1494608 RepID=UPI000535E342|nr:DNA-formamidopyrimidine glycosylase family protein [Arthrobacter sp. PAMC 25486]AIY02840.1 putative endonuclease VIII/DNA glycosylase [Arthrobacter sp. PAMC 25486]